MKIKLKLAFHDKEDEYDEMKKWEKELFPKDLKTWGTHGSLIDLVINKIENSNFGSLDMIDLKGIEIRTHAIQDLFNNLNKLYDDAKSNLIELNVKDKEEGYLGGRMGELLPNKKESWGCPSKEIEFSYNTPNPEESNEGCFTIHSPNGKSILIYDLSAFVKQLKRAEQLALTK
jgi:hypothetical protein